MLVFRMSKPEWANDLSGEGAQRSGGRWNFAGFRILYTSETAELAVVEQSVHLPPMKLPPGMVLITIEIPVNSIKIIGDPFKIHPDWNDNPSPLEIQQYGTDWLHSLETLVLKVPSSIIPISYNYLINPAHPYMKKVMVKKIVPFIFDPRIKGNT